MRLAFYIRTTRDLCAKWAMSDALPRGRAHRPANLIHEITMTTEHVISKVAQKCILILTIKESRGKLYIPWNVTLITIYLVFLAFNESLLAQNHICILFMSLFMVSYISSKFGLDTYIVVSSANDNILLSHDFQISLTYMR